MKHYVRMSRHVFLQSGALRGAQESNVRHAYNISGIKEYFENRLFIVPADLSVKSYFNSLAKIYPENFNVLTLLGSFFQSLENEGQNASKEFYLQAIGYVKRSNISERDKMKLTVGLSVAYASSRLWVIYDSEQRSDS